MSKLKMLTPDMADKNFSALAKLFPNAVTETVSDNGTVIRAVDAEVLQQEINTHVMSGKEERYQFTWPDKKKSLLLANAPIAATLRPCREESVEFDTTQNLYIEGDNLDVLKLLRETYLNCVKMIYIDPPYNTGNDFVYEDDFSENAEDFLSRDGQYDRDGNRMLKNLDSNGRFHTDWLNMIYPRLRVARDLLTDDGIILINMDEHEITNLQKICIEVFGEMNDLGTIIWDKRNPKGDAKGISYQHEYIVAFAKNKEAFFLNCKIVRPKKNAKMMLKKATQIFNKISQTFTLKDANQEFQEWINTQKDLSGGEKAYHYIDVNGDVYQTVSMAWPNNKKAPDDYFVPLIHPITKKPCPVPAKGWRNPSATMKQLLAANMVCFGEDETTQPRRKYLLSENMNENIPSLLYFGGSDNDMLAEMKIPFETPKVVSIIKEHVQSFATKGDIILDFFSGSATTAHAVMQLNAEDGGKRQFIMVQLPELTDENSEAFKAGYKNICEIGKERIRRAGAEIKETHSPTAKNLDIGFRVLKLDSSNMKDVYYTPQDYFQCNIELLMNNIKENRTPEDLLFQVMLELGIPLSSKIEPKQIKDKTVLIVNSNQLIACFETVDNTIITQIAQSQPRYAVFRDLSFTADNTLANIQQIFTTYSP
ncbi:MAG: site-specific DNA-methyltransferase, partial [Azoarcus sp.]|nr:site-specific DNA-methyltransferase [Azoarcus sp.]